MVGVYCGAVGDEEDSGALEKSFNSLITIHTYTTAVFFLSQRNPWFVLSVCLCIFWYLVFYICSCRSSIITVLTRSLTLSVFCFYFTLFSSSLISTASFLFLFTFVFHNKNIQAWTWHENNKEYVCRTHTDTNIRTIFYMNVLT